MIRTYLARVASANIREAECRLATQEICYPGISSCMTITFVNNHLMVGIHCTVANTSDEIRDAINEIKAKIASEFSECYVIGALSVFKPNVFDKTICTRKKISNEIIKHIKILSNIKFHDTTMHADTQRNAHIFIRKNPFSISYCAAAKCLVSGQTPPLSVGRKYISANQFTTINNISDMIICR